VLVILRDVFRPAFAPLALVVTLVFAIPAAAQTGSGTIRGTGSVSVRATPGGTIVGKFKGGRKVTISCQRNGKTANGSGGRSAIWDRVSYKGKPAFVADAVVSSGAVGVLVAPYCDAPTGIAPINPAASSGVCSIGSPVALLAPFTDHSAFVQAAVPGAQASDRETDVPAAVTLAQAIQESGWGQFSAGGNNYFGIKAQPTTKTGVFDWGSDNAVGCVLRKTQEEVGGRSETQIGAFRAYTSLSGSIRDHGARLRANPVYAPAFKYIDDDNRFAKAIGRYYATESAYASKLIAIMDKYNLKRYDVRSQGSGSGTPTTTTPTTPTTTTGGIAPPGR
jgi:hypothetical protein